MTGAAGLIGGAVSAELATRGFGVIGLVRRDRRLRRVDGTQVEAPDWDGRCPIVGRVALVAGDLCAPLIGLDPDRYARLSGAVDLIVHCAALTSFEAPAGRHRAVNVGGTAAMLALAEARPDAPAGFVQISTAYVCGIVDGRVEEQFGQSSPCFANGYEASKHAAEALIEAAVERGVRTAIVRPSIVVGRGSDGAISAFDAIYQVFRLVAQGRIRTIPATPGASLDFVPIDHVVEGIATIVGRLDEVAGRVFHLVSGGPMPVAEFAALVGEYADFARPELVAPEAFDAALLSPAERRIFARVAVLYASYFQRNPRFCDRNARELLGRAAPPADRALLRRQIDFAVRAGFLPGNNASS